MSRSKIILILILLTLSQAIKATTIDYAVTSLGGNSWEYIYTVHNDMLLLNIEEITLFFVPEQYENINIGATTPTDWDILVIQPDPGFPENGLYDALATGSGIVPGGSLSGFSVQFDYLATGIPGTQLFDIVDPNTFNTLDSGNTSLVPLPGALWLFLSGIVYLFGRELQCNSRRTVKSFSLVS